MEPHVRGNHHGSLDLEVHSVSFIVPVSRYFDMIEVGDRRTLSKMHAFNEYVLSSCHFHQTRHLYG